MAQELEFEQRVMLTKDEYEQLKAKYSDFKDVIQTNYYFDTGKKDLKKKNTILRLRIVQDIKNELTIKAKSVGFCKETNELISAEQTEEIIKNNTFKNPFILEYFKKKKLNKNSFKLIGKLSTKRATVYCNGFTLFLDKNYYEGRVDYDLEIESDSDENAKKYLDMFIKKYHLSRKDRYIPKSGRLFKVVNY